MRSALTISIALHLAISLIAFNWVQFRRVDYVPRQVYNVTLVTPQVVQAQPVVSTPPPEEPTPPAPEPDEKDLEDELPPPPVQPAPKPKKKPPPPKEAKKKPVPTTEIRKTETPPEPNPSDSPGEATEHGSVQVDAADFPFAHYISRMRQKIAANWRVPAGSQGEDRFCRVYFRVHRDGSVTNVDVEESSGLFMFDQSAQRAVVEAAPMPPLPREFSDAWLGVHFSFAYREQR